MSLRREPLIALDNVSLSTVAGMPGKGLCTVRLLDAISLSVFRGDMVLLRGGPDHGSAPLLRVLADDDRVRGRTLGRRIAQPHIITRYGIIPGYAVGAVINAWTTSEPAPLRDALFGRRSARSVVYLLRASTSSGGIDASLHDWIFWSSLLRKRGGTVVIAEGRSSATDEYGRALIDNADLVRGYAWQPVPEPPVVGLVREPAIDCDCNTPAFRVIQLGHGRITGEQVCVQRPCRQCARRMTA